MNRIAFYDMDKTVTRRPTWTAFLVYAAVHRSPLRLALFPAAGVASLGYLLHRVNRGRLKEITQGLFLGRAVAAEDLARLANGFADKVVARGVLDGARARIAADRAAGYRLVLATASHDYYAAEIARRLGFDAVVATQAERDAHGRVLPRLRGENCYGAAKLAMVEEWMKREGIDRAGTHVRAYSDHVTDAPLLEWADEAFAVNAHGPLRALAHERGWPMLEWDLPPA